MKENNIQVFNFVARTSKIHDEIFRLRNDLREFIRHTDYVLPGKALDDIRYTEDGHLGDAQENVGEAIVSLCNAMRIAEEEKEEETYEIVDDDSV